MMTLVFTLMEFDYHLPDKRFSLAFYLSLCEGRGAFDTWERSLPYNHIRTRKKMQNTKNTEIQISKYKGSVSWGVMHFWYLVKVTLWCIVTSGRGRQLNMSPSKIQSTKYKIQNRKIQEIYKKTLEIQNMKCTVLRTKLGRIGEDEVLTPKVILKEATRNFEKSPSSSSYHQ